MVTTFTVIASNRNVSQSCLGLTVFFSFIVFCVDFRFVSCLFVNRIGVHNHPCVYSLSKYSLFYNTLTLCIRSYGFQFGKYFLVFVMHC